MLKTIYTEEYRTLLQLLREARMEAGLTQVDLAQMLVETQSFVSKIERGDIRLDIVQLRTICQAIGISLPRFIARWERHLQKER